MEKNMFVFITKNGVVYNRTNGKNSRLYFGQQYELMSGQVQFVNENNVVSVIRTASNGRVLYQRVLENTGTYMVSALFVQQLPKSQKEVKNLYNRLKNTIGKPKFKIDVKSKMKEAYKIKLHTWIDKGFNYRFIVTIRDENMPIETVNEIYDNIKRTADLDLTGVIRYYYANHRNNMLLTVNEEFFKFVRFIEEEEREQSARLSKVSNA
jgi:hypothetical protein